MSLTPVQFPTVAKCLPGAYNASIYQAYARGSKYKVEGEVIHVIAKRCSNVAGLLHKLTTTEETKLAIMTLSRAGEKDDENYATKDKRVQRSMAIQGEIFHRGRDFR